MFDPQMFNAVRKPLAEAETLPPRCYHDKSFYELEVANIFLRKWVLIGRSDEWKQPGDFLSFERFGVPFFVVKDRTGTLHAFSNSCRHRGARVAYGSGNCAAFVCPYHSWTYDLDGRLRGATGMEHTTGFDKTQYGLHEIKLAVWHSFVFVNFASDCVSLETQLGDLGQHIESYDFENVRTVGRNEWVVNSNWKSYVENSMEWLHHSTVHRKSILGRVASIERTPVCGNPGDYVLVQSRANGVSRAVMGSAKSFPPVSTLKGRTREGSHYVLVYPFTMIGCDVDSIWYKQMIPEGPDKVRNIATYCFHKEICERPDFDEIAPNYYKRFTTVVEEDNEAMIQQFAGLLSPFAQSGRFSDREILVHRIDNWILDQVLGRNA
jgi:phenylpropionate dioxygenase-like ring-hydroxylating dioxygenase large terminal subunit